jgi:hypothetical protein
MPVVGRMGGCGIAATSKRWFRRVKILPFQVRRRSVKVIAATRERRKTD